MRRVREKFGKKEENKRHGAFRENKFHANRGFAGEEVPNEFFAMRGVGEKSEKRILLETYRDSAKYFFFRFVKQLRNEDTARFFASARKKFRLCGQLSYSERYWLFRRKLEPINPFGFFYALSKLCLVLVSIYELPHAEH